MFGFFKKHARKVEPSAPAEQPTTSIQGHAVHVNPLNGDEQRIRRNHFRLARIKMALQSKRERLRTEEGPKAAKLEQDIKELLREQRIREAMAEGIE